MHKRILTLIAFLFTLLLCPDAHAEVEDVDSVAAVTDTVSGHSSTRWIKQLIDNGFHINEPGVDYPRFPRFALNVYNWGDRVFNSYDPEYVVSTGKNWKAQAKTFNWMQNYSFFFPHREQVRISSDFYADVGGYVSFMAVSVGYMFNANELLAHNHSKRTNFNLNFTCSRFTIDYTRQTIDGGARLTHVGEIFKDTEVSIPFNGLKTDQKSLMGFYIFNHRRYSHAAAYCYSKYQLKDAGSWVVGFNYLNRNTTIDFTGLDPELFKPIPDMQMNYHFHYSDYMAIGGYAHSWALKPRVWLLNLTSLLGLGYKQSKGDSSDGSRNMLALQGRLMGSVVYNHRGLFVALNIKGYAPFFFNGKYTMINTVLSAEATVGLRF
ncbi:MAG: DUF4421 domain-containing protein [Muribaculaceae bacterium]|nr:DUF4421 domain-containing protein [Muribaculaceae bacterium]MDE6321841.1 DUF4421 domain-containing protein [Muribaculaceae bacterium]